MGSIPGSILIGKYLYGIDPREHGSGNAGATNTMRVLGFRAGLLATVVDLGKGLFAAGIIATIRLDAIPITGLGFWDTMSVMRLIAGIAAVAGHMYPVLAGFRGGKGVNTSAGVLLAITPVTMIFTFGVFFLVLYSFRYVSLASLVNPRAGGPSGVEPGCPERRSDASLLVRSAGVRILVSHPASC